MTRGANTLRDPWPRFHEPKQDGCPKRQSLNPCSVLSRRPHELQGLIGDCGNAVSERPPVGGGSGARVGAPPAHTPLRGTLPSRTHTTATPRDQCHHTSPGCRSAHCGLQRPRHFQPPRVSPEQPTRSVTSPVPRMPDENISSPHRRLLPQFLLSHWDTRQLSWGKYWVAGEQGRSLVPAGLCR